MNLQGAALLSSSHVFDPISQSFISQHHKELAEVINDFDDTLYLVWIPPTDRTSEDTRPFAVIQQHPNFPQYVVMYLREDQLDHRVLATLMESRMRASGNLNAWAEAQDMAYELLNAKKRAEQAEIAADKARFLWKTPLHSPTMDGKKYRL